MNFLRSRKFVGACAIGSACLPLIFVAWWHLRPAPDIFYAGAPTRTINDFTPTDRTGAPIDFEGIRVRPIIASPVYLLFVPRRQTDFFDVTLVALPQSNDTTTTIQFGYRATAGSEGNRTNTVYPIQRSDGWYEWRTTLPRAQMMPEERGALRIVASFVHNRGEVWLVREVRINYRDR